MDLSIIVLNLNTRDFLRDCLQSLRDSRLGTERFEVIVADNGSTDGSGEMVRDFFPQWKVVDNGRNLGFAGGNNAALPYLSAESRYVLFLNSDTRVPPETLPEMVDFLDQNPKVGAATCYVETRDGTVDWNCHRGFPTPLTALTYFLGLHKIFPHSRVFGGYYQTYKDLTTIHEVDGLEGAFLMVRRKAAAEVALAGNEWWDEDFFFFGEDLDFCYRLKEKGWQIMFYPKVKIWHYKGATHGFNQQGVVKFSREDRQKLIESTTVAMKLFYQKHYSRRYPAMVTAAVLLAIQILGKMRILKGGI